MADYGVFRTNDAKRIAAATRRVEGTPRTYLRVPHRVPLHGGGGTAATTDDGYPPGTDGCNCGNCLAGVTIPGALECCKSHPRFSLVNPWLACADTDLTLELSEPDVWLTEPFDGPDCDGAQNEYRWQLTIDIDGRSYLTLLLETDNGCDPVCIVYGRESFKCQCSNSFSRDKPYGTAIGVPFSQLSCYACVKVPHPKEQVYEDISGCATCFPAGIAPTVWQIVIPAGITNGMAGSEPCSGCDGISGTFVISEEDSSDGYFAVKRDVVAADASNCGLMQPGVGIGMFCEPIGSLGSTHLKIEISFQREPAGFYAVLAKYTSDLCAAIGPIEAGTTYTFTLDTDYDELVGYCEDWPATIEATPVSGLVVPAQPTSDGVCDETCGEPVAPTDPDPGGCCFEGGCYDYWDQALCDSFGGTWYPDGCENCELVGPCCVAGTCITTDGYTCQIVLGGTLAGGDCDDGVCDEGACCSAVDGTCSEVLEGDCQHPDYFWGAGTDCTPDPCGTLGACCRNPTDINNNCGVDPDCECVLLTEAECNDWTGVFDGAGTVCGMPGVTCECRGAICDLI